MTEPTETPKQAHFPATVVSVLDDYRIVINRGAEHGIKVGERFLVYELGQELTDPDTGESLGRLEIVRGTGLAEHVQPKMTTVRAESKKRSGRRIVRKSPWGMIGGHEEVIDPPEEIQRPFEYPQVGDKAKPV